VTSKAIARSSPETAAMLDRLDALAIVHRERSGGTEIVWRQIGRGSPLVLLHGGHGSWLHWVRNVEALSARHSLWLPDLPGFGDSGSLDGAPHAEDRLERLVGAVAASTDALLGSDSTFSLAGFSFGGLVAARLAALMPNVGRLALLGPAGHGGVRRQSMEMANWRTGEREQMLSALRHNLAALMLHDDANIDSLAMTVHERTCVATRFRSKSFSRKPLLKRALDGYRGPTLLIWGEHDVTAAPVETAQNIADVAQNREWCLVPGAGHWVQYERPDEINQLLLGWFNDGD
jgi:pimeloyl-ACP methyl ester carboxylesterase